MASTTECRDESGAVPRTNPKLSKAVQAYGRNEPGIMLSVHTVRRPCQKRLITGTDRLSTTGLLTCGTHKAACGPDREDTITELHHVVSPQKSLENIQSQNQTRRSGSETIKHTNKS